LSYALACGFLSIIQDTEPAGGLRFMPAAFRRTGHMGSGHKQAARRGIPDARPASASSNSETFVDNAIMAQAISQAARKFRPSGRLLRLFLFVSLGILAPQAFVGVALLGRRHRLPCRLPDLGTLDRDGFLLLHRRRGPAVIERAAARAMPAAREAAYAAAGYSRPFRTAAAQPKFSRGMEGLVQDGKGAAKQPRFVRCRAPPSPSGAPQLRRRCGAPAPG